MAFCGLKHKPQRADENFNEEVKNYGDRSMEAFSSIFSDEGVGTQTWAPPVDIYETDDSVILTAEVPGVDPKDVDVRIEGNTLYLSGERKLDSGIKEENFRRMERVYGPFSRSFTLPASVN